MSTTTPPKRKSFSRKARGERKALSLEAKSLVKIAPYFEDRDLPLVIQARVQGADLPTWAAENRQRIADSLAKHGAIVFRDFHITDADRLTAVVRAVSGEPMLYKERSSPRHSVAKNVYTSTDYPPDQPIFPHNEHSYSKVFPLKLYFSCSIAAPVRGGTPLADTRRIYARMPQTIKDKFKRLGWMFVRNYGQGFGLDWRTVFQTEDRATIENYCRENRIECEWLPGDRLRTRQVRPVTINHPLSGEETWFNHLTFYHVTSLPPVMRDAMLKNFATEDLPNNTYYGDGSAIEDEVLETLRGLYLDESRVAPWQEGDLVLLDNVLTAHARETFEGPRKILFAMAEPIERQEV